MKFNIGKGAAMDQVTILQFRQQAGTIIRQVQKGKRLILTYRGKPVMRLEPIADQSISPADPFYRLDQLAVPNGKPLNNEQIDEIVYKD